MFSLISQEMIKEIVTKKADELVGYIDTLVRSFGFRTIGTGNFAPVPDTYADGTTAIAKVVGEDATVVLTETDNGKFAICLVSVTCDKNTFNARFTGELPKVATEVRVTFRKANNRTYATIS